MDRRASRSGVHEAARDPRLLALTLGALGIVFGDIGTSPLYTLRECLHEDGTKTALQLPYSVFCP